MFCHTLRGFAKPPGELLTSLHLEFGTSPLFPERKHEGVVMLIKKDYFTM
jgi:hypothetical protein